VLPLDRARQSRELLIRSVCGVLVTSAVLRQVRHVLTLFVVAAVFASIRHPVVSWLERRSYLPRVLVLSVVTVVLNRWLVTHGFLCASLSRLLQWESRVGAIRPLAAVTVALPGGWQPAAGRGCN
jgi:predicted PurR-regulated permease PerM